MAHVPQARLFSWEDVESCSDLDRLSLALDYLPDDALMQALEARRAKGRDDYPVQAMWNAVIAGVVFQHPSIASLRRELGRNPALMDRCGFEMLPVAKKPAVGTHVIPLDPYLGVPPDAAFSRFLANLIKLEAAGDYTKQMLASLRQSLSEVLPDFGRHLGFDGKAIESHSTGQKDRETSKTSDPDADWGHHKTSGIDANGKAWSKVKSWFGYGLHVIADTHYELPVAVVVTCASASESTTLRQMIGELFTEQPVLAQRCEDFSADRGLDAGETKALLWDTYRIRPLIDTRELWRAEKQEPGFDPSSTITRPLFPDRADTLVHTEMGHVRCCCPQTGEVRDLVFQGFEADRDTLKYRCPAAYVGSVCAGAETCHAAGDVNPGAFGRVVRIKITEQDRRIFVPTPHGSPSWHRGYNRRTALERINNRIDNGFGFEHHFIRGINKMKLRVGLAFAVMLAMALGHIKQGRAHQMRSLVQTPRHASG